MAPVARELSSYVGVIEPLQAARTVDGQVEELAGALTLHGEPPVALVGWSWGAWLSLLVAARRPGLVRKVVLVGCPPFEQRYAEGLWAVRLARLDDDDRAEAEVLADALDDPDPADAGMLFARLGQLMVASDSVDPIALETDLVAAEFDTYRGVWPQAEELRRSGELLDEVVTVPCPVVAVHGEADPHPAVGVLEPLWGRLPDFRFIRLERCGHYPWLERNARERFFEVLRRELRELR
jgi:pimeloyl-ACP methyl ester carboxylesterase